MYATLHVTFATDLHLYIVGPHQQRIRPPFSRRRADGELDIRSGLDPIVRVGRQVDRVRRTLEDAIALSDAPPLVLPGVDGAVPGEEHQTDLPALGATPDGPTVLEP
jgi:hypothetical protein